MAETDARFVIFMHCLRRERRRNWEAISSSKLFTEFGWHLLFHSLNEASIEIYRFP
jgi:hypothetical protein